MGKKLHIVFPKEHMQVLLSALQGFEEYIVTGTDYHFDTFYDYAVSEQEIDCDVALIVGDIKGNIPIVQKVSDFLKKVTDIRIKRPNLRLVVCLTKEYEHIQSLQQTLVSLSVYDIHFVDQFDIYVLIDWIEKPKNLADMKNFIVPTENNITPIINKPLAEKKEENIVEEQEMSRIKIRKPKKEIEGSTKIVEKIVSVTQTNIAFISLSRGAGSTFHATNFSSFLRSKDLNVGLYEYPLYERGRTYLIDHFDFNELESTDLLVSAPHAIHENKSFNQELALNYKGISIYPVNYKKGVIETFTAEMMYRYINTGRHTIKVVDLGYLELTEENKKVLQAFDHIYIIVDLSPSSFLPNYERFIHIEEMKEKEGQSNIDFIINPYVSTVPKHEIKELKLDKAYRCNQFELEMTMKAFFKKSTVFDGIEELREEFSLLYEKLCDDIKLPISFGKHKKGKLGIFNKLSFF